jgi:hypothetical protein
MTLALLLNEASVLRNEASVLRSESVRLRGRARVDREWRQGADC